MILTITGSDSTGGSGVQADIKTIFELGDYAVSAITSITVQNTLGIQEFFDIPAEIVSGQIEAIMKPLSAPKQSRQEYQRTPEYRAYSAQ